MSEVNMAKNNPLMIWKIRQSARIDLKFYHGEMLDGVGISMSE